MSHQEGIGPLRILPDGISLDGNAFIMNELLASSITSRKGKVSLVGLL
jgi:hypothetical protein